MYTSEVSLENFKRFAKVEIDLSSNITLLLGPNSSGKSSILKALLALKQTASPANEHEVFSAQGDYVDLGVYKDYVIEHDLSKKIRIGLTTPNSPLNFSTTSKLTRIEFCFGYDFATEQARLLEIVVCEQNGSGKPLIRLVKKQTRDSFLLTLDRSFGQQVVSSIYKDPSKLNGEKIVDSWCKGRSVRLGDRYQFTSEKTTKKGPAQPDFFTDFPISIFSNYVNTVLRGLDRDFFYVGPLRRSPSRSYARTAHLLSVGASGEHTPSVLANLKAKASKERSKERPQGRRMDQLTRWIERIFPDIKIDSKTIEELVKLEIERAGGKKEVISDVGFGFSQVLPILVQAAVMPENTTLLVEQPELHLHPSAQTRFAEVIADASNSGRRFLIETHSEHFIRGLQVAVSNGTAKKAPAHNRLKPTDLKFIYVPKSPAEPREMALDIWGDFTEPWPSGFFDEGYLSSLKILHNKMHAQTKLSETYAEFQKTSPKSNRKENQ